METSRCPAQNQNIRMIKHICPSCKQLVPVTAAMQRRKRYICAPCEVRRVVDSARRHPERKRRNTQSYLHSAKGKLMLSKKGRRRTLRYPEKLKANYTVQTALLNKSLRRKPCERCGEKKAEAHHDDYSQPLNVRWLCWKHHQEHHRALLRQRQ